MQLFVQLEGIRLGPNGFDLRQVPNGKVAVIIEISKVKLDRESAYRLVMVFTGSFTDSKAAISRLLDM
jgi:hypothetical protein